MSNEKREEMKREVLQLEADIRAFCKKYHKGRSLHQSLVISGLKRSEWERLRNSIDNVKRNKMVKLSRKRKTLSSKRGERQTVIERLTDFYNRLVIGTKKHIEETKKEFDSNFLNY